MIIFSVGFLQAFDAIDAVYGVDEFDEINQVNDLNLRIFPNLVKLVIDIRDIRDWRLLVVLLHNMPKLEHLTFFNVSLCVFIINMKRKKEKKFFVSNHKFLDKSNNLLSIQNF